MARRHVAPLPDSRQLKILSANVRGLRTNLGELTHNMILKTGADIVVTTETFLNENVEPTFGKIKGYTQWLRRDRRGREGGGIAICHKSCLQVQILEVNTPEWMEVMFLRVILNSNSALLLCAHYRPQWQGRAPLDFLTDHLDDLLTRYDCQHVMIVGDLNYHLVQSAYDDLLSVQGLVDHVDFPTHILGGILDPVISDLDDETITCTQQGQVGTSDHFAILSSVRLAPARDEDIQRKIWLWDQADWPSIRRDIASTDWDDLLSGDTNQKSTFLTNHLIKLQEKYVPARVYISKADDQPWFGYRCRLAADNKYKAWLRFKRNPTRHNKNLLRRARKQMSTTSKWAERRWQEDLRRQLSDSGTGGKKWWNIIKEKQGLTRQEHIPPLNNPDGTVASSNLEKAELLGRMFSNKMAVPDPAREPPQLPMLCHETLTHLQVDRDKVRRLLRGINTKKAMGPDDVSPHILHKCADVLADPLTSLFQTCLEENTWPSIWKEARIVPVHKKKSKSDPTNYRPISLLSAVSKILEKIIVDDITHHLEDHGLLSNKQFGFRSLRSTADLLLLLSKEWQDALDIGLDTLVIALDIAGAFDRVWHRGLLAKLSAKGIQGDLLHLIENYLTGRTLRVVIGGQTSQQYPVRASVPQGSVLGPVLWNIFIDDLLEKHPEVAAYADDCTFTTSYSREDSFQEANHVNNKLESIHDWGTIWQVNFASDKTQAMIISRSPAAKAAMRDKLSINNEAIPLQDHISILGIDVDECLRFDKHINKICQQASLKVSALRRIAKYLDPKGLLTLYKAQVRPHLEYASHSWLSSAPTHLSKLDKIQRRALRLIQEDFPDLSLDTLEHRRDVGALTVFHKAQVQRMPHLTSLRLPTRPVHWSTRTVQSSQLLVGVPRSRASQHLRTFSARVARLWNIFTTTIDVTYMTTQQVKEAAHRWRATLPTPTHQLLYMI